MTGCRCRYDAGMYDNQTPTIDPLRPLADAIKRELRIELLAELRAEIVASRAEAQPECIMLSIDDVRDRYGVGRIAIKQMIAAGRLRAVERICRGGRMGTFLHLADCERVLAGRKATA